MSDPEVLQFFDPGVEIRQASSVLGTEGTFHGYDGPDRTIEIVEVRDLGNVTLTMARARGHGAVSHIPYEETIWSVARWRGKKAVWWGVFSTKAEALEAVGLRE